MARQPPLSLEHSHRWQHHADFLRTDQKPCLWDLVAGWFCMVKTVVDRQGRITKKGLKPDIWDLVAGRFLMVKTVLGSKTAFTESRSPLGRQGLHVSPELHFWPTSVWPWGGFGGVWRNPRHLLSRGCLPRCWVSVHQGCSRLPAFNRCAEWVGGRGTPPGNPRTPSQMEESASWATFCSINAMAVMNKCESCPVRRTNVAWDDASVADTTCKVTIDAINGMVVKSSCGWRCR